VCNDRSLAPEVPGWLHRCKLAEGPVPDNVAGPRLFLGKGWRKSAPWPAPTPYEMHTDQDIRKMLHFLIGFFI
jgi:hypothetical protein